MTVLAETLRKVPGVVAVTSLDPEAAVTMGEQPDSQLGLYFRGDLESDHLRQLGLAGTFGEPGEWGRILNGGARLTVDGHSVGLSYRRIEVVEHWLAEAQAGRFEVDHADGYVAGLATYVLAGELATCEALSGELPRPGFPEPLRASAPPRWRRLCAYDLELAQGAAEAGDIARCVGLLGQAAIAEAQARLAARGEWALSERAIVRRAGLGTKVASTLAAPGDRPFELGRSVTGMRLALRAPEPSG